MKYHIFYSDNKKIRAFKPYIGGCDLCEWKDICRARKFQKLHHHECVFSLSDARHLILMQKSTDVRNIRPILKE